MEIVGKIIVIGATETIGAKEFKKRLLVVETQETYAQKIPVEFTQDKCFVLDKFAIGDLVKVGINLRGSEWQGKYYANIQGWKIDKTDNEQVDAMPNRQKPFTGEPINNALTENDEADDLPF